MEAVSAAFEGVISGNEAFKSLSEVKIAGVKDVKEGGVHVVIITVPYKQIKAVRSLSATLIPELEKKLDGAQAVIVGQHRAFPKTPEHGRRYKAIRNYGRTLRSVNDALLEDMVYPTAIVGKRVHYDVEGKQTTKVLLDKHDSTRVEERLQSFGAAYNRLTGLKTVFEIAQN